MKSCLKLIYKVKQGEFYKIHDKTYLQTLHLCLILFALFACLKSVCIGVMFIGKTNEHYWHSFVILLLLSFNVSYNFYFTEHRHPGAECSWFSQEHLVVRPPIHADQNVVEVGRMVGGFCP